MENTITEEHDWNWNNGMYFFYRHKNDYTDNLEIDLFNSREAQNDLGHFKINNNIIITGKQLGAVDRESGKKLLIDYVKKLK